MSSAQSEGASSVGDIWPSLWNGEYVSAKTDKTDSGSKRRARHSKLSTKILQRWLAAHSYHPYPTEQDKEMLRQQSGLTIHQINLWFTNARRRSRPNACKDSAQASQLAPPGSESVPELGASQRWESMNPLDRWRHSPPEEEPASWSAITQAASATQVSGVHRSHAVNSCTAEPTSTVVHHAQSDQSVASSLVGLTSDSSACASSSGSSGISLSLSSATSAPRATRYRHRRDSIRLRCAWVSHQGKLQPRPYQCTFCTDRFKSKYDWTRHEGSLHLVLEQWVCSPSGPVAYDPTDGTAQCCFCQEPNPSLSHLQSHNPDVCNSKSMTAKTFYRKDHMRQHLRHVHGVSDIQPSMSSWKSKITSINCRCGFCAEAFSTWSDRNDHIAAHFKEGASMKDWKGCRGLDPAVALLVENAMPPYLIAAESNEFEHFSALRVAEQTEGYPTAERSAPTTFEMLTLRLGEYVRDAIESGIIVTDEIVRKKARLIMYGDDDAWNQTPADNTEWLRLFKNGLNLNLVQTHVTKYPCSVPPRCKDKSNEEQPINVDCSDLLDDHLNTGPLGTQAEFPWSWERPECLAEFRQMLQQRPARDTATTMPPSATLAGECTSASSLALPGPDMIHYFSGANTDQTRPQNEAFGQSDVYVNISSSEASNAEDLSFPFDFTLFDG